MKTCKNCQTDNLDTANYCKNCGCRLRMGLKEAAAICFDKYAVFKGRASRSEFWYFVLFYLICCGVVSFMAASIGEHMIESYYRREDFLGFVLISFQLIFCLPLISVSVRRLHDIGLNGAWNLIYFAQIIIYVLDVFYPLFVFIAFHVVFVVAFAIKGKNHSNKYGEVPIR